MGAVNQNSRESSIIFPHDGIGPAPQTRERCQPSMSVAFHFARLIARTFLVAVEAPGAGLQMVDVE